MATPKKKPRKKKAGTAPKILVNNQKRKLDKHRPRKKRFVKLKFGPGFELRELEMRE